MPGPPLPPTTIGTVLSGGGAPITVELYLDIICPFSRKMWAAVVEGGIPATMGRKGTYVHEAALAVRQANPDLYVAYVTALFAAYDAGKFKDDDTWDKTRKQIYDELLDVAASVGADKAAVSALLSMKPGGGNSGNDMTQMIKWMAKYHRCRGVHVTPTVHVNGLEAGVVSSGWTTEQWLEYLKAEGADNFRGATVG